MAPEPGLTVTTAVAFQLGSLRGIAASTVACASRCSLASSVVWMVSPPRLSSATRSSSVAPKDLSDLMMLMT